MRTSGAPRPRGGRARLRQGRLSLAYMHLRQGDRRAALAAVAPQLWQGPPLAGLRDVVSIARGI